MRRALRRAGGALGAGLMLSLAAVACDPTTLVKPKPDLAVDAEVDMEVDLGPSACERACADVYACAATDDLCPGIGAAHEDAVVTDCLTRCQGQRALATEVNRQEACAGKVAFFSGVNTEFDTLCRFGPRDLGAADAGALDTGIEDAGLQDAGLQDAGLQDAAPQDTGVEDAGLQDAAAQDTGLEGLDAGLDVGADQ